MAVEDTEAPGAHHQKAGAREENARQLDSLGEGDGVSVGVTAGDQASQPGGSSDAEHHQETGRQRKESEDGAGHAVRLLLPVLAKQPGIDRDEGGGEHAFAK